jgi:hypothetical protein
MYNLTQFYLGGYLFGTNASVVVPTNNGEDPRMELNMTAVNEEQKWWYNLIQTRNGESILQQMQTRFQDFFSYALNLYDVN